MGLSRRGCIGSVLKCKFKTKLLQFGEHDANRGRGGTGALETIIPLLCRVSGRN